MDGGARGHYLTMVASLGAKTRQASHLGTDQLDLARAFPLPLDGGGPTHGLSIARAAGLTAREHSTAQHSTACKALTVFPNKNSLN
jgi:hypothetical protein